MQTQEHKKQLHDRILERRGKLEAALAADPAKKSEHARAADAALAQLATHFTTKWEDVGEVESKELAVWLESTALLVNPPPVPGDQRPPIARA
jgi:hypothetical protein